VLSTSHWQVPLARDCKPSNQGGTVLSHKLPPNCQSPADCQLRVDRPFQLGTVNVPRRRFIKRRSCTRCAAGKARSQAYPLYVVRLLAVDTTALEQICCCTHFVAVTLDCGCVASWCGTSTSFTNSMLCGLAAHTPAQLSFRIIEEFHVTRHTAQGLPQRWQHHASHARTH
jgi:hypothetical protein